jgi:hypothetical protein
MPIDAGWILVDDPCHVRHLLGRSESPGIILRSICDVSAPRAGWRPVDMFESDLPECDACRRLVSAAAKGGS